MPTPPLTIVTWNVLAAPWAAPGFYPVEMDSALLDRHVRADLVAALLTTLDADVMCLQETTPPDLAVILERLGHGYEAHQTSNRLELWSDWSTAEHPWEPNGTAVVWRRGTFSDVLRGSVPLSDDGNVAATIDARHVGLGRRVRIMSLHLDADRPEQRRVQLPVALAAFAPDAALDWGPETIDVIAGDCNEDTVKTDLGAMGRDLGFDDALTVLDRLEPTHPYARPTDDFAPVARLDHVLVRGAQPVGGRVVDSGVWAVPEAGRRLAEHLRLTGSDHLPLVVSLR